MIVVLPNCGRFLTSHLFCQNIVHEELNLYKTPIPHSPKKLSVFVKLDLIFTKFCELPDFLTMGKRYL